MNASRAKVVARFEKGKPAKETIHTEAWNAAHKQVSMHST
jgi:hypothetical protein